MSSNEKSLPQNTSDKDEQSVFTESELGEIYQSIVRDIERQRDTQSALKKSFDTAKQPNRNSFSMPLAVIIASIILCAGSSVFFVDDFAGSNIFSRIFPTLESGQTDPTDPTRERIAQKILDEQSQEAYNREIEFLNLQTIAAQSNADNEDSERTARLEEMIDDRSDLIQDQRAQIREQGAELLAERSENIKLLEDYNTLLDQQNQSNLLLDQYQVLVSNINEHILNNEYAQAQAESNRFRVFLRQFTGSSSEILQLLQQTGNQYLAAVSEYLILASRSDRVTNRELQQRNRRVAELEGELNAIQERLALIEVEIAAGERRAELCASDLNLCRRTISNR